MDDAIVISTMKTNLQRKIAMLNEFCGDYGMKVNALKIKSFDINGEPGDAEPQDADGLVVEHCDGNVDWGDLHLRWLGFVCSEDTRTKQIVMC